MIIEMIMTLTKNLGSYKKKSITSKLLIIIIMNLIKDNTHHHQMEEDLQKNKLMKRISMKILKG